jgi:hypothetical protein
MLMIHLYTTADSVVCGARWSATKDIPNLKKIPKAWYKDDEVKMIWRSVFSPVTKRHVERQILHTHPLHLLRIIQDVDQYSRYGVIPK